MGACILFYQSDFAHIRFIIVFALLRQWFLDLSAVIDPTDKMPDGFLQELLRKFPFPSSHTPGFGQAQGSEGGEEDAEYAIYEQDDDDEDDD